MRQFHVASVEKDPILDAAVPLGNGRKSMNRNELTSGFGANLTITVSDLEIS